MGGFMVDVYYYFMECYEDVMRLFCLVYRTCLVNVVFIGFCISISIINFGVSIWVYWYFKKLEILKISSISKYNFL